MHKPPKPLTARFNPPTDHQADTSALPGGLAHLLLDLEKYRPYIDGPDISPEERDNCIRVLWSVVFQFTLLSFGVHPIQQARNSCGKGRDLADQNASTDQDMVHFPYHDLIEEFVHGNGSLAAPAEKGVLDV